MKKIYSVTCVASCATGRGTRYIAATSAEEAMHKIRAIGDRGLIGEPISAVLFCDTAEQAKKVKCFVE